MSTSENINVLIVIDTDYVKEHYSNPSQDPDHPTGIAHTGEYMIAADPRGIISGQGTADLNFKANVGDNVSFRGTSIYQNSDDAVIIYDIVKFSGEEVFNTFTVNQVTRTGAVQPDPDTTNGIPPLQTKQNFLSLDSKVKSAGTENFKVRFGLYTLDDNGEDQSLYGYFQWDPTVTVQ